MSYEGGKTVGRTMEDDDDESSTTTTTTTSSEDNNYGDNNHPAAGRHRLTINTKLRGKTIAGGKTVEENDDDDEEETGDSELMSVEEDATEDEQDDEDDAQSVSVDDEETEDEEDHSFQQQQQQPQQQQQAKALPKRSPEPKKKATPRQPPPRNPRKQLPLSKKTSQQQQRNRGSLVSASSQTSSDGSQLEAWKEVHAALTHAVLVAKESIASKKLQRRFWLETMCANLKHPKEALPSFDSETTDLTALSEIPLLQSYSVWFKPDQRKKKRGPQKKLADDDHDHNDDDHDHNESSNKKARTTKASLVSPKPLSSVKMATATKTLAKKTATIGLKKRKKALLPTKRKAASKTASEGTTSTKPKIRLSLSSKAEPPVAIPTLSVFQDDTDDDDDDESNSDHNDSNDPQNEASPGPRFALKEYDDLSSASSSDNEEDGDDSTHNDDDNDDESDRRGVKSEERAPSPDWNSSQHQHPFLSKRDPSDARRRGSAQGTLDNSEIYSTFGQENNSNTNDGVFGADDSSEDEIPF